MAIDSNIPKATEETLLDLDTKTGEVQATPTAFTVLSRLKGIYDKLESLFGAIGTGKFMIWNGTYTADVDSANRLQVATPPPSPPPTATGVIRTGYGDVSTTEDDLYTITNGQDLIIQRFSAGAEETNGGSVVELFDDPNGDLSVLNVIDVVFTSGDSDQHDLDITFTGDGTRRILMRRKRLSGGAVSMFGRWEGYEEDTP